MLVVPLFDATTQPALVQLIRALVVLRPEHLAEAILRLTIGFVYAGFVLYREGRLSDSGVNQSL